MYIFSAIISSITMGVFYIFDIIFGDEGTYTRPSHAMVVSSIVPLIPVPLTMLLPWWQNPTAFVWGVAFLAGAILIWANWFYFLVMFPSGNDREAELVEGSTELALYEGTTPVIALVLSMIAGSFIIYDDVISFGQGVFVILTVLGLVLFANADGYSGINRWSYRVKLIAFALLAATSQMIQDLIIDYTQTNLGMSVIEAYVSVSPAVWLGMASGIIIIFWKKKAAKLSDPEYKSEGHEFLKQWPVMKKYTGLILLAELIAIVSYAALLVAYAGEHVAVAQAIGSSFPIVVFVGGLLLIKFRFKKAVEAGDDLVSTTHLGRKFAIIAFTLVCVAGVILF